MLGNDGYIAIAASLGRNGSKLKYKMLIFFENVTSQSLLKSFSLVVNLPTRTQPCGATCQLFLALCVCCTNMEIIYWWHNVVYVFQISNLRIL
jgi:hypothetical protein